MLKSLMIRAFVLVTLTALAACSGVSRSLPPTQMQLQATHASMSMPASYWAVRNLEATRYRLCPTATGRLKLRCFGIGSDLLLTPDCSGASCLGTPGYYGPSDLQAAYGITTSATGGKGQTVAVVDAFGYKQAKSDLAEYRSFYHLPAANLKIVNQDGKTSPLPAAPTGADAVWDFEQALDLDMVSAICPNCNIVLVEVPSTDDLYEGASAGLKLADAVSNSWGGPEFAPTYTVMDDHPGKVVTASSGDDGAGIPQSAGGPSPEAQPCGFAGVVCVGGTSLVVNNGKRVSEVVWDGLVKNLCGASSDQSPCATGSGCSKLVAKPSWQHDHGCLTRSANDLSVVGDPYTGVIVVCTPCPGATPKRNMFAGAGGTSASSPLVGAMYALAGNASTATSASLWAKGGSSAFNDVTSGTNDKKGLTGLICSRKIAYICKAGKGYDGPTGWGTPNGLGAL